ncbi:uncharacterized protein MJAP1_003242 [Malassezia japonica]|uniref:Cleavage and polyadenylation specificity factor subunit 2 n=1 Tax=Malassezia japonica TaxID=223818 RepID=A0AAF0F5Q9_9BASI|nr:uncharacterized protein MJAP1_003242 [Malassezia japonica]WFD40256.1 hypothetical protein MJAP1_003242 [Malassezia japonica]
MLEFTPLAGPYCSTDAKGKGREVSSTEQPKAVSYLVEIDGCRVLLDCGAPEDFVFADHGAVPGDPESTPRPELVGTLPQILERIGPTIDVVLLTHAELSHLGFYAYARAHYGLQCTVYATLPVQTMGRLVMQEAVRAWAAETEIGTSARLLPTETEVDDAFDAVRTLRFLQPTPLDGKSAGLVLTAYNAGHSLGGTVWKLRSPSIGTVVMALDWNHSRERHLDRTALLPTANTPFMEKTQVDSVGRADVLITDIERGLYTNAGRKDRDAALLDRIHQTLQGGHSVLIPVDSAARLLELLVLLDQHWAYAYQHQRFPLCLVSHTGQEFVERARTFIEWMSREWAAQMLSDDSGKGRRRNKQSAALKSPLDFPFLRYFSTVEEMHSAVTPSQPKVVLATPASLTHGPARQLLSHFLSDPDSLVLLMSRGEPGSVLRTLWERWNGFQADADAWRRGKVGVPASIGGQVSYELRRRLRLTGEELRAHLEREQQSKEKEAQEAQARAPQRARPQLEADEDGDASSASDSSDEDEPLNADRDAHRLLMSTRDIAPERLAAAEGHQELSYDIYLRGLASRAPAFPSAEDADSYGAGVHYRMFPFVERKRKVDGYGEAIDTSKWLSRRRRLEEEQEDQLDPTRHVPRDEQKRVAQPEPPSKYVAEQLSVAVRCHVMFVDMQGLNDGRALKMLLPQLQPRRLIMVNGDAATNADLYGMLYAVKGMSRELYMPPIGTTVRIGELMHAYSVKLADTLLGPSHWSMIEDYNVMPIRALAEFASDADVPTLVRDEPAQESGAAAPTTLYIGDLKLSALKAHLAREHRIRADFAGEGVLVCDGAPTTGRKQPENNRSVTVKKEGAGRIVIEGNLSSGLGRIRESVYDLYAQVHQ